MSEFPHNMEEFWLQRRADLVTAVVYCESQIEQFTLRKLGQMALPIEAALEEENAEMLSGL